MSAYVTYDFVESMRIVNIPIEEVDTVIAAWGNGGPTDWSGGFLVRTKDSRYAYVTGWNDYTGWGCQDGAHVEWYDEQPALDSLPVETGWSQPLSYEWDIDPIDLNKYVRGELERYV